MPSAAIAVCFSGSIPGTEYFLSLNRLAFHSHFISIRDFLLFTLVPSPVCSMDLPSIDIQMFHP